MPTKIMYHILSVGLTGESLATRNKEALVSRTASIRKYYVRSHVHKIKFRIQLLVVMKKKKKML